MQKSPHLYSVCLHQWRLPYFALKYPRNPPPPGGRPSLGDHPPPHGGDRRALWGEISRGIMKGGCTGQLSTI